MSLTDILVFTKFLSTSVVHKRKEFSWRNEFKHLFSSKFLNILWWPVFKMQQNYITSSPLLTECKQLPGFSNLWKTIQKGSFAYNALFLNSTPARLNSRTTDLADITTLFLFFGDEFIDGITLTAGKSYIQKMLSSGRRNFYMQVKKTGNTCKIYYGFNLEEEFPPAVLMAMNEKYHISYYRFYKLLQSYYFLINQHLKKIEGKKAIKVAEKIADVCNNCFESYLHDVMHSPIQDSQVEDLKGEDFHELKTRHMQRKLLELRCLLAGKKGLTDGGEIEGWLDIMTVVQVYDDLQDVVLDDGVQDNRVLYVAKKDFNEEWEWFLQNKELLGTSKSPGMLLSLHMPCSVQSCLHLAAIKIKTMNWEQQKIMHYLLSKNWFLRSINCSRHKSKNDLNSIYKLLKHRMNAMPEYMVKCYAIDTCFHDRQASRQLLKKVDFKTAYQLRYNLLAIPPHEKVGIFDRVAV